MKGAVISQSIEGGPLFCHDTCQLRFNFNSPGPETVGNPAAALSSLSSGRVTTAFPILGSRAFRVLRLVFLDGIKPLRQNIVVWVQTRPLTNFGWTRTADPNQINWAASPGTPPLAGNIFPVSAVYPLSGTPGEFTAQWSPHQHQHGLQPVQHGIRKRDSFGRRRFLHVYSYLHCHGAGWTQDGGTSLNWRSTRRRPAQNLHDTTNGRSAPMTDSTNTAYNMFAMGLGTNGTPPVLVNFAGGGVASGTPQTTTTSVCRDVLAGNTIVVALRWGGKGHRHGGQHVHTITVHGEPFQR